jgi:hypothetical protein
VGYEPTEFQGTKKSSVNISENTFLRSLSRYTLWVGHQSCETLSFGIFLWTCFKFLLNCLVAWKLNAVDCLIQFDFWKLHCTLNRTIVCPAKEFLFNFTSRSRIVRPREDPS